jgi:hypothetical protein
MGGIDFTPVPYEVQLEGIKSTQPGFRDGTAMVTFSPPEGWRVDGAGAVLQMQPTEASAALARVETRPLPELTIGSPEWLKAVQSSLSAVLPKEAQELTWLPETEQNPVVFNQHDTLRLEATYTVLGQSFRATVLVCHLEKQQLLMMLTSRDRDFPKLYEAWRRSLFTWQGLQ